MTTQQRASYAQNFVVHKQNTNDVEEEINTAIDAAMISDKPSVSPSSSPPLSTVRRPTTPSPLAPYASLVFYPIGPGLPSPSSSDTQSPSSSPSHPPSSSPTLKPGSTISGHTFLDTNLNGSYETQLDYNFSKVHIWLFTCGGTGQSSMLIGNTLTSIDGIFTFDNLDSGNYMVVIELPIGYESSSSIPIEQLQLEEKSIRSNLPWEEDVTQTQRHYDDSHDQHTDTMIESLSKSQRTCTSICFKLNDNQTSNIELSFGIKESPTSSPSTQSPSGQPTSTPIYVSPTNAPSYAWWIGTPTYSPSTSKPVTISPSTSPTSEPTSSQIPSIQPSQTPTRFGIQIGPVQTVGLRITLFGIDNISDKAEWNKAMEMYIQEYFNNNESGGEAFDVDASIIMTSQTVIEEQQQVTAVERRPFRKQQLRQSRIQRQDDQRQLQNLGGEPALEIIYNQVSTYKTSDPTSVDENYIIQEPFATTLSRADYISFLQSLNNTDYDNVTSVSSVRLPTESLPWEEPSSTNGVVVITPIVNSTLEVTEESNGIHYGIYIFLAGIFIVFIVNFVFIYRNKNKEERRLSLLTSARAKDEKKKTRSDKDKKKSKDPRSYLDGGNVSNVESSSEDHELHASIPPPYEWRSTQETKESTVTAGDTSRTDIEVHDIYPTSLGDDTPSKTIRFYDEPTTQVKGPQEKQDKEKPAQDYTPPWAYTASQTTQNVVGSPPTLSPNSSPDNSSSEGSGLDDAMRGGQDDTPHEVIIDIKIPPGRVGCIIDSSPKNGPYICEIDDTSPLRDELCVGDRIVAVDDVDVRRFNAINVSKLLGRRCHNDERILTIMRQLFIINDDEEDEGESSTDSPYAEIEQNEDERSVSPLDTYDDPDTLRRSEREGSVVSIDPPGHI